MSDSKKDIVAIASESAKTLAAAVTAAGLVQTLQGEGPFTVFAPLPRESPAPARIPSRGVVCKLTGSAKSPDFAATKKIS